MINNVKVSCFYLLFGFGWQVSAFGVFFEQGTEFEAYDPENGFHEDAAAHFGCACRAVGEDDRYFGYVETVFQSFGFTGMPVIRRTYLDAKYDISTRFMGQLTTFTPLT